MLSHCCSSDTLQLFINTCHWEMGRALFLQSKSGIFLLMSWFSAWDVSSSAKGSDKCSDDLETPSEWLERLFLKCGFFWKVPNVQGPFSMHGYFSFQFTANAGLPSFSPAYICYRSIGSLVSPLRIHALPFHFSLVNLCFSLSPGHLSISAFFSSVFCLCSCSYSLLFVITHSFPISC